MSADAIHLTLPNWRTAIRSRRRKLDPERRIWRILTFAFATVTVADVVWWIFHPFPYHLCHAVGNASYAFYCWHRWRRGVVELHYAVAAWIFWIGSVFMP